MMAQCYLRTVHYIYDLCAIMCFFAVLTHAESHYFSSVTIIIVIIIIKAKYSLSLHSHYL